MYSLIFLGFDEILEQVPSSSSKRGDREEELGKGWSGVGAGSNFVFWVDCTSKLPAKQYIAHVTANSIIL